MFWEATSSTTDDVKPLAITTFADLGSTTGEVAKQIKVAGGTEPYTYTVSGGKLPDGVTLNKNTGALSGTATAPGEYTFTVKVADSAGLVASRQFAITVTE